MDRGNQDLVTPRESAETQHAVDIWRIVKKWLDYKQEKVLGAWRVGTTGASAALIVGNVYSLLTSGSGWYMGLLDVIGIVAVGVLTGVFSYNRGTHTPLTMEYYSELCEEIVHYLKCNPAYAPEVAHALLQGTRKELDILRHALALYYFDKGGSNEPPIHAR